MHGHVAMSPAPFESAEVSTNGSKHMVHCPLGPLPLPPSCGVFEERHRFG